MSVGLLHPHERLTRPAPYGSRLPARADEPPDGWEDIASIPSVLLLREVDKALIRAVVNASQKISRRRFLNGVGKVGLVVGLAGARLGLDPRRSEAAYPCNICTDPGETDLTPGGCGPTELCGNVECQANGLCNTSHTCPNGISVKGQAWATGDCVSQGGYWDECCNGNTQRCRDCCGCQTHATLCRRNVCPNDPHYKCICRVVIGTCSGGSGDPGC
jgi:ubiquitin